MEFIVAYSTTLINNGQIPQTGNLVRNLKYETATSFCLVVHKRQNGHRTKYTTHQKVFIYLFLKKKFTLYRDLALSFKSINYGKKSDRQTTIVFSQLIVYNLIPRLANIYCCHVQALLAHRSCAQSPLHIILLPFIISQI